MFMSRTFKNRKFKLTSYAKNQPVQLLLTFLTTITRWSYSTANYYVLIGQNLTGEFMHKIYAASGTVCTDSWNWQSLVSSCDVFSTGCSKWNTPAIKILLLFMVGFFIGFLVEKCAACQSHRKSDFRWHRFPFHLAWCVEKSQAIPA